MLTKRKKTENSDKKENISIITNNLVMSGDLFTENDIRIDGEVKGNVHSKGKIVVGSQGRIKGNLEGYNIVVHGKVTGDCKAWDEFIIKPGGSLKGNIRTKRVTVMDDGCFDGNCIINNETPNDSESSVSPDSSSLKQHNCKPAAAQMDAAIKSRHVFHSTAENEKNVLPAGDQSEENPKEKVQHSLLFYSMKNHSTV